MNLTRRSLLIAGTGAMVGGAARAQSPTTRPIVLGQVSLSFYAVVGAVVQEVLERLGHTVVVLQGSHEEMFPMLADARIDLMAAALLPEGHGAYWARYGGGAQEIARYASPDGVVNHAEIRGGDSVDMGEAHGKYETMPAMFYVYVPNVEAVYRQALAAGAKSFQEPTDQPYGDRNAAVQDNFGNKWYIATHVRDVQP